MWAGYAVQHHRGCGFAIQEEPVRIVAPPFLKIGVGVAVRLVFEFRDHGSFAIPKNVGSVQPPSS